MQLNESKRKGIILAGGFGSRLYPITKAVSKQLIPVYDKPMIYYPLTTLMLAGIREILIICLPKDKEIFQRLFGDGSSLGLEIKYKTQPDPKGLADAFIVGEQFLSHSPSALILGDNIFYGDDLIRQIKNADSQQNGSTVFAYRVKDPRRYGVITFKDDGKALKIEEKPSQTDSFYAITGLYYYDETVVDRCKQLVPSSRGELEISDLNNCYLKDNLLNVRILGRGTAWIDTGTFDSLHNASEFIKSIEDRQGLKIGCPEEVAWRMGFIHSEDLYKLALPLLKNSYGEYLRQLVEEKNSNYVKNK